MSVVLRFDVNGSTYFANTYEDTAIQITKRVSSLDSLSSQSIITKETFRVPLDGGLAEMLGYISDINQDAKVNLNKAIEGQIIVDNLPRFVGSFQVLNIFESPNSKASEVELIFKGSETNLKQVLTNIPMSELYEGELIPYTAANVQSFVNDANAFVTANGYFYPLVDYGQKFTADTSATVGTILGVDNLTQTDFKPAVTIADCFDKMPIDITWDSSIDDLVERQGILLHNNESKIPILDTSPRYYTGDLSTNIDTTYTSTVSLAKVPFQVLNAYNQTSVFDLPNDVYIPAVSGNYTIRLQAQVDFYNGLSLGNTNRGYLHLVDYTASPSIVATIQTMTIFVTSFTTRSYGVDVTLNVNLTSGNNYGIGFSWSDLSGSDTATLTGFRWYIIASPAIVASSNIDVPLNCPELDCWDIFSEVIKQCNGIVERSTDGVYNIIPWVEWINSSTTNIFLDKFVDPSKNIKITPFSVKGAKRILLENEEDEDAFNDVYKKLQGSTYGRFLIRDTGTDFSTSELKIKSSFASSPLANIDSSGYPILKLYNDSFETIKGKPRLLQFNAAFDGLPLAFGLTDIFVGGGLSYDYYPFCGHWQVDSGSLGGFNSNDYNFGQSLTFFAGEGYPNNTLYKRFWEQYIQETYSEDAREISLNVLISIEVVDTLQMNEVVYFRGSKCRIVEISNVALSSNSSFPIKLMKRIDIEKIDIAPFWPYDVINGIVQWKDSTDNSDLGNGSGSDQTDLEASALAYGFAYDANLDIAVQRGQLLQI
jgi:hypothetical protein